VDGNLLCRTSDTLSARCADADPALQATDETHPAVELEGKPNGAICRPSRNLIPYKYDDLTGVPFDPRPWEATLGSSELQSCAAMLTAPGEYSTLWSGGYLCCP
jgi:hypothetical protein